MKNKILSFLATAALGTTLFFASCKEDKCKNVTCNNGGTCIDGSCECSTGYEGTKCETESRTKFVGTYAVSESKNGGTAYAYGALISSGTGGINSLRISNISNNFFAASYINATVDNSKLTITSQDPDSDGYTISGSTSSSSDYYNSTTKSFKVTYTITGLNGATPPVLVTDTYVATFTKI
jgi:hypothetical protein